MFSLFRVDPVAYNVGDLILPQGNYQDGIAVEQKRVEKSLVRTNSLESGLQRKDCVFVFDDLKNALLFWSKKAGKANLYKVGVETSDFVHKGDMNYLDFLLEIVKESDETNDEIFLDLFSKRYWQVGYGCVSPCYEIMARKVKVEEIVIEANSKMAYRIMAEINTKKYVHLTDTYKSLVNKYY